MSSDESLKEEELPPEFYVPPEIKAARSIVIATMGYGGRTPREFYEEVEELKPDVIFDVRLNPFNAFTREFTKPALEERYGPKYVWLKGCGKANIGLPHKLSDEATCLNEIRGYIQRGAECILLLASQKLDVYCHRKYILDRLLSNGPCTFMDVCSTITLWAKEKAVFIEKVCRAPAHVSCTAFMGFEANLEMIRSGSGGGRAPPR